MKKKKNTKFLSAILLSLLAITAGVSASPMFQPDTQLAHIQESVKLFEKNPERFLQTEDLGLKSAFENPTDLSIDNAGDEVQNAINEGALNAAIENRDYDAWKEALQKIEGFSENTDIISEEDFEILAALHNPKDSEEDKEKTDI